LSFFLAVRIVSPVGNDPPVGIGPGQDAFRTGADADIGPPVNFKGAGAQIHASMFAGDNSASNGTLAML